MRSLATLLVALPIAGCPRGDQDETLTLGTFQAVISQEEGQDRPGVVVTIPALASGAAGFAVSRDGQPISVVSSPSAALPGGTDLIDESAAFATRIAYEVIASFPSGGTIRQERTLSLVRTLSSFPTTTALANGCVSRPEFRWDTQSQGAGAYHLEVMQSGGLPVSLAFGRDQSRYCWGDDATASADGRRVQPRSLFAGVRTTARTTALAGPAERTDPSRHVARVLERMRSKPYEFTP